MSGGLLEKAQQISGDSDEDVAAAADAVIVDATVPNPSDKPPIMLFAAGGTLLLCSALLYFMYLLPAYSGVAIFGLLLGSAFLAYLHVKTERNDGIEPSITQLATIAVVYLLLAGIPYVAAMDMGGSVLLSYNDDDWYDENAATVSLTLRQSAGLLGSEFAGGDVAVTVTQDGTETWSGTVNVAMSSGMEGNSGTITLNIADFYANNAQQVKSFTNTGSPIMEDHPYRICVDVEGVEGCTSLPTLELTRTVTDVDEKATAQIGEDCDNGYWQCVEHMQFQSWVGVGSETTDNGAVPFIVRGDYEFTMNFTYVDEEIPTLSYPQISVILGTDATWDASEWGSGADKIGETSTEYFYEGDGPGGEDTFERDDVFDDYGCYNLNVTSTQGGEVVAFSNSYYMLEQHSGTSGDGGTRTWETFESVSSCPS